LDQNAGASRLDPETRSTDLHVDFSMAHETVWAGLKIRVSFDVVAGE